MDFYEFYISKNPNDLIAKSIKKGYNLWADLETGLGEFTKDLNDNQISDFLDSKANLENCLSAYLNDETNRFNVTHVNNFIKEFSFKISTFYYEMNLKERNLYKEFLKSSMKPITYCFITFNYTNVLDEMTQTFINSNISFSSHVGKNNNSVTDKLNIPLHIHGTFDSELILGVDNLNQIKNIKWHYDEEIKNCLVKPNLNEELGQMKIEQGKRIIDGSRYICIFGMSIGDTDSLWCRYIIEWLMRDKQNRLILYVYDSSIVQASGQEKLRLANKNRNIFIQKNNELKDEIKKRI